MKKLFLGILVFLVLVGGAFQQAQAQDKKVRFGLNVGKAYISEGGSFFDPDDGYTTLVIGGALNFRLGNNMLISPEIDIWVNMGFDRWRALSLGAVFNYQIGLFFVGAGVVRPFPLREGVANWMGAKMNMGVSGRHLRFAIYMATTLLLIGEERDRARVLGASVGYIF